MHRPAGRFVFGLVLALALLATFVARDCHVVREHSYPRARREVDGRSLLVTLLPSVSETAGRRMSGPPFRLQLRLTGPRGTARHAELHSFHVYAHEQTETLLQATGVPSGFVSSAGSEREHASFDFTGLAVPATDLRLAFTYSVDDGERVSVEVLLPVTLTTRRRSHLLDHLGSVLSVLSVPRVTPSASPAGP